MNKINIATGTQANDVELELYSPTFDELCKRVSVPAIGAKDGSYFIRCAGTIRNNKDTSDVASVLILDGDKRINEDGEIVSGAPDPELIHTVLTKLDVSHCIYSSHSNTSGLHKYRVVIPCTYSPEQLPILLDYCFNELHKADVMLAPVNENRAWSQAWFFPRVPDAGHEGLFQFYRHDGVIFDANATHQDWLKNNPQPERAEPSPLGPKKPIDESNGRRNSLKEFNQSFSCEDILLRNGYIKKGIKFLRPDSESKIPAVQLCNSCKDGVERVYSHGNDILNDTHSHDAFDCYRLLECKGDWKTALRWSEEINNHNTAIYRKEQEQAKKEQEQPQENTGAQPFSLSQFSLNGRSAEMRKKVLTDTFVLPGIAILGEAVAIYAKPNTGKTLLTLHLLISAINSGLIKGEDVFYLNFDDGLKGLTEKVELAEKYGFHMIGQFNQDFKPRKLCEYLDLMIKQGNANGKVLILDTAKKFTDLMDKKTGTAFMETARSFTTHGGTVIMLAHVNKHRNGDGKVIYAGTSDIVDESDCAFTLDEVSSSGDTKTVMFENFKQRGDVEKEIGYTYSTAKGQSYIGRLESVKPIDEKQFNDAVNTRKVSERMEKDIPVINAILDELSTTSLLKSDLLSIVHVNSGHSKAKINKVLSEYTGTDYSKGHRWFIVPGTKNAKEYCLLNTSFKRTTASEYSQAKGA